MSYCAHPRGYEQVRNIRGWDNVANEACRSLVATFMPALKPVPTSDVRISISVGQGVKVTGERLDCFMLFCNGEKMEGFSYGKRAFHCAGNLIWTETDPPKGMFFPRTGWKNYIWFLSTNILSAPAPPLPIRHQRNGISQNRWIWYRFKQQNTRWIAKNATTQFRTFVELGIFKQGKSLCSFM